MQALIALHDWTFLTGQGFLPAVNALLVGPLLYQSRLVPRVLPVLGFIGALLLAITFVATMFGFWAQVSSASALLTIPIALWELSLGIWLIVKGFQPSPITADLAADPASRQRRPGPLGAERLTVGAAAPYRPGCRLAHRRGTSQRRHRRTGYSDKNLKT